MNRRDFLKLMASATAAGAVVAMPGLPELAEPADVVELPADDDDQPLVLEVGRPSEHVRLRSFDLEQSRTLRSVSAGLEAGVTWQEMRVEAGPSRFDVRMELDGRMPEALRFGEMHVRIKTPWGDEIEFDFIMLNIEAPSYAGIRVSGLADGVVWHRNGEVLDARS